MRITSLFKNVRAILGALVILAMASTGLKAGITNVDALGFGSSGAGSYSVLTPVTEVREPAIWGLTSILTGSNGTTVLAGSVITTALYLGQATGLTNVAVVAFPAETDTGVASFDFQVPLNYRSGAKLYAAFHTSTTFTAGSISVTADVYANSYDGATTTAKLAGTAVQLSTLASVRFVVVELTNSNLTGLTPGQTVTVKLRKAGNGIGTTILELQAAWFGFRPYGVFNGRCVDCPQ